MGAETAHRTRKVLLKAVRSRALETLDDSLEADKLANPFLRGMPAILDALRTGKIECRVYDRGKFHAKAYITHARLDVIGSQALVGSSNFTKPGLTQNIELNVQVQSAREVAQLQDWFETHWDEAREITDDILVAIERHTRPFSPFEVMAEITEVIERHGGWPAAFLSHRRIEEASVIPFHPPVVVPKPKDRYANCVPLIPLQAAAGAFSDPQFVEDDGHEWVAVATKHRLRSGMFVAQVVGKSMEPIIPDGAYCLFRAPVHGTRQGKTVLIQLRDTTDPETGQRYTVKRYESTKASSNDSWRHTTIRLTPANHAFDPIVLTDVDEGELTVIAEFLEVLQDEQVAAG